MRILIALVCTVALSLWATAASAQSCCAASQSSGPVRLSMGQVGAVGVDASGGMYTGVFADTAYRRLDDRGQEYRQTLFGTWRLADVWQVSATVPLVQNYRSAGDYSEWGGGLGDLGAQARYEVITTGASASWPGIGIVGSVTAPTGRAPMDSMERGSHPLQSDVTGAESWRFAAVVQVEWTGPRSFLAVEVGPYQGLPYTNRSDQSVLPGTGGSARLSTGRTFAAPLTWDGVVYTAVGANFDINASRRVDGVAMDRTAERMTGLSIQVAGFVTETIHLTLGGTWDLPFDGLGQNRMAGPGIGLAVRKVFYDY